jgi:CheY-like chemotaxis protein
LVEDDVLVRFFVAEELRAGGYVVLEAANADEALELLATGGPVDLLLTDVRMPGALDGAELAHRVRVEHRAMKVVVLSAHLREPELGVEVHGFFAKPVDMPRLARHIKALLDGRVARVTPLMP